MLVPENENPKKPFTWADLKEFCNSLIAEQLKQPVILAQDESFIEIKYASDLGDDQYYFIDAEYSTTKEDYDPQVLEDKTFEEALETEDYSVTPGTNVYLFDE